MSPPSSPPDFPFARNHDFHPSPLNAELRHEAPTSKVKLYDGTQAWLVTKHKDICEALSSKHLSADRRTPGYPEIHSGGHKAKEESKPTFVNLDDPAHREQRDMIEAAFTPAAIEKLRPMIQETIDKVFDRFAGLGPGPVDLIENVAMPIPTQIVYRILEVPEKDIETLSKDSSIRTGTSREAAETANQGLQKYMGQLVDRLVENPQDGLISKLVKEQYRQGRLTKDEIVNLAFLVLTAGNAALINSIGLGVLTLFQHPDQLEELKKDAGLAPQVVNELLRYNTASALNSRRAATENLKLGSTQVEKGDGVICSVQSGDRDEEKTPSPDKFDIHRRYRPEDVLGFGYGPHRCQGEALSRTELEMVFGTLFQKMPNLRLANKMEELEYTPPTQNIGVMHVPVYV